MCGLILGSLPAAAQLLSYPVGETFGRQAKFDPAYIAANSIAEIRLKEEVKKDGERIRSTGMTSVYRFDREGRTVSVARINGSVGDTLLTFFEYAGNRLECEIHNDAAGMYSYCYAYGPEGLPVERKYGRTGRKHLTAAGGGVAKPVTVTTETYRHRRYEGQVHSTLFNSSGRPYLKEIRYYEDGSLMRYLLSYVMSDKGRDEKYAYDDQDRMIRRSYTDSDEQRRMEYAYDGHARLSEERRYAGEELTERIEYVYHSQTGELTAELKREERKNQIRITTYAYVYR